MKLPAFQHDAPGYAPPEEYRRPEREASHRHEYYAGEMQAMAGAQSAHNCPCFNRAVILGTRLAG